MSDPTTLEWLREAARRISRGIPVLTGRLLKRGTKAAQGRAAGVRTGVTKWLGESTSLMDTAVRWVMLAGAAWAAWTAVRIAAGIGGHAAAGERWLMWPAAAILLVAAYRAGSPPAIAEPPAAEAPLVEKGPWPQIPEVPRTVFLALLHGEIGTGRAVHLAHVAKVLTERGPAYPWDVPAVTVLCRRHGIPVEKKVRAHGRGATRGVLKSALPPASEVFSWASSETVDTAGQGSSTGPSTSTSTEASTGPEVGGGEGFVTVPDAVNPHRTEVRWIDREPA